LNIIISRDAKRMILVNGVPEYNITVWDLENFEKMGEFDIETDLNFISVNFSKKSNNLISVLYKEKL
jgi:hypothetical protein